MMQNNQTQVQELHDGIFLRKKCINGEILAYIFQLEVLDLIIVDFQADFTGSENITIKGVGEEVYDILKQVEPRTVTPIATVQLHEGWKLKSKFRFMKKPISKDKQRMYLQPEIGITETEKKTNQIVFKKQEVGLLPFGQVNIRLAEAGIKFLDHQFPPCEQSILGKADKSLIDDTVNHWRRPHQIFEGKQFYLFEQIGYKNLKTGKLLDHAFYSTVVNLVYSHPSLIESLFLNEKQINHHGIYQLRICKNGEWQKVTIDDYIPCEPLSKPKFVTSSLNEIWVHLLQKAYAKIHRQYIALHQLQVSCVFNDLTGCPTIILPFNDEYFHHDIEKNLNQGNIVVFFCIVDNYFEEDKFVPIKNYAYRVLSFEKEDGNIYYNILSHDLTQIEMSHSQIVKSEMYACVCKIQNWQEVRIKGKFVSIDTGNKENPYSISMSRWYYALELFKKSDLCLCLHQQDILIGDNSVYKKYYYVNLMVFQKGEQSLLIPVAFKQFIHNRQFHLNLSLQPGRYIIVPIINEEKKKKQPPQMENQIYDIFRKLDLLMRRELKYSDLQPFFKVVDEEFSAFKYQNILKQYTNNKKGLGYQAFKRLWYKNRIYWQQKAIEYYSKQILFVLSIHCKQEISILIKSNIGTQLNNKAHCQLISRFGVKVQLQNPYNTYIKLILMQSRSNIIEYMVENIFERKIELILDCTEFPDYEYVPASGRMKVELESGEKRMMMKIMPKKKNEQSKLLKKEIIKIKIVD